MSKRFACIGWMLVAVLCLWTACKNDVTTTGESVLDADDAIVVLVDTFAFQSAIDSCKAIISQADSFLLGEIETDYGLLRASILTQLACPEGYKYPEGFTVDSVDSICLFMSYSSWVGDANSPLAIDVYKMDKNTFRYSSTYATDLNIDDYCSRNKSILTNHRIVVASEKLDSIASSTGVYTPMVRMRVNDDFMRDFASIQSFESQEAFNDLFKGLLIETSFGSATMLNISDIALGVFYHFSYKKGDRDTTVNDMKAFYANSEVRTVNHLTYGDKKAWIEKLQNDSDTYNYIIAPAGAYTRMRIPMAQIADTIFHKVGEKRPYVNKAEVLVAVENKETEKGRNSWLQPSNYMLMIKESSMERFFKNKELPTDTCALLASLTEGVDSVGNQIFYYSYDLSDFLTNQLRQTSNDSTLNMMLVPVTVGTTLTSSSTTTVSSVLQQQTMSATKIRSAKNGMKLEIVYSGF
ncbi:MAG: DUF4270 family protein [Paludibacteraceae bacterium]|nr:DUF4270 family protein [Paludibacteraceae bacterium]